MFKLVICTRWASRPARSGQTDPQQQPQHLPAQSRHQQLLRADNRPVKGLQQGFGKASPEVSIRM